MEYAYPYACNNTRVCACDTPGKNQQVWIECRRAVEVRTKDSGRTGVCSQGIVYFGG